MLRFSRGEGPSPVHAPLLETAGVRADLNVTQCSFGQALTAARLCVLSDDAAASLARRQLGAAALARPGILGPRAEVAAIAAVLRELDAAQVTPDTPEAAALAALRAGAVEAAAAAAGNPRRAVVAGAPPLPTSTALVACAERAGVRA